MLTAKVVDRILIGVCVALYLLLAQTVRHETLPLLLYFFSLFFIYLWVLVKGEYLEDWFYGGIIFRICILLFLPTLSDDYFRFVWDGRLLAAGLDPFAQLPSYYIQNGISVPGITPRLLQQLNSPEYFTVYPPVSQFVFWLAVTIFPQSLAASVIAMKVVLVAADIGCLVFVKKLLQAYSMPSKNILIYALNPLVILEFSGNLHFEVLMLFFIILFVWWMHKQNVFASAAAFSLAVASKLVPMMILPAVFFRWRWRQAVAFYFVVLFLMIVWFVPLLTEHFVAGMSQGVGYYFRKFEFNASIYYLVREYGFWKSGYNVIATAGWKLAAICAMMILFFSLAEGVLGSNRERLLRQKSIWAVALVCFTLFFLFSTTIHPWYITSLVLFSVFTNFRYAIIWSGLVFLTYAGYTSSGFDENLGVVAFEYAVVIPFFLYEIYRSRNQLFHNLAQHR